jgi:hypothetical protein
MCFGEASTKDKKITLVQRNYKETLHIQSTLINFFIAHRKSNPHYTFLLLPSATGALRLRHSSEEGRGSRTLSLSSSSLPTSYLMEGGGGRTSSLSSSEEIRSITSTNLVCQEDEALKIRQLEEGGGPSLSLPIVEEGAGSSLTLPAVEEGGGPSLTLPAVEEEGYVRWNL